MITCLLPDRSGSFSFRLRDVAEAGPAEFEMPEKILAISDIEGNFGGFSSILRSSGVIDSSFNWSFGNGHLVLVGDFFDRGSFVTECLWLIYKLEQEAETAGGKVHFILGNHEVMVMRNDLRYVHEKYKRIAGLSGFEYNRWFSPDTELGSWLRKKNCITKIGSTVFVHGGISPELLATGLSAQEINDRLRDIIDKPFSEQSPAIDSLILRSNGPLWYRGIAKREINSEELDRILKHYSADRMTIGHTIFENMSELYGGRVTAIDVDHAENFANGKMYALMISENVFKVIDLLGNTTELQKLQD
ncbi:MAG: metallophosphoesterase [Ignavibacteria bacterium]|nr:metallophosphoesterase [Ignavibacteria bacterium]